jgi:hypothetical protein
MIMARNGCREAQTGHDHEAVFPIVSGVPPLALFMIAKT